MYCVKLNYMKYFVIYIAALLIILAVNGCDSPAPTELYQDTNTTDNPISVQVVAKDTGDVYYNNGFDTTGVANQSTTYANTITVSGIKVTQNGSTKSSAFAQAVFYDMSSNPVHFPNGLIFYLTPKLKYMENVKVSFDNFYANLVPYRLGFSRGGYNSDTTLGYQYVLNGNLGGDDREGLIFHYNSSIRFHYENNNPFSKMSGKDSASFNIPTPPEITGSIRLTGSLSSRNLSATISWNKKNSGTISVIIGAIKKYDENIIPLYTLTANDNGNVVVPPKLLNAIPGNEYSKLVFTLVRRIEFTNTAGTSDLFVRSQSIHSIILDIP